MGDKANEDRPFAVTGEHLDVFQEIGNIGAGNAATALATMLNRRIDMSVPAARMVPFNNVTDIVGGPENIVAGVLIGMTGDLSGFIMLVLNTHDAAHMLHLLGMTPTPDVDLFSMDELGVSTLREVSNILVGSYLTAISSLTGLTISQSVPELVIDMAGAILSVPVIEYGKLGESVLLLETEFYNDDQTLAGHFFLIPDLESYYTMLKSLGIG